MRRLEEIVTPGDRSPQRLLSLRAVPATSGEERKPAVETRQDGLRRKESHARRRQLDGQRETIQATTDGDDASAFSSVSSKWLCTARARSTKRRTASEASASSRRSGRQGWELQGWDGELMLAGDVEWRPAGDQNLDIRAVGEEVGDERRRVDDVLEVVEHQEQASRPQIGAQRRSIELGGGFANAEGAGDGGGHHRRGRDRRQRDEPDAIGVRLDQIGGHMQGQAGLAGATGSGEREQADTGLFQPAADLRRQRFATDERRQLRRQVMGLPVQTLERREVRGKTGGGELKDMLDFAQVAQPMLAEIDELEGISAGRGPAPVAGWLRSAESGHRRRRPGAGRGD